MEWHLLVDQWQAVLNEVERIGGKATDLVVEVPATKREVEDVEAELGMPLPASLRDVLLKHSKCVHFYWVLPEKLTLPKAFKNLTDGRCHWSLRSIADAELLRRYVVAEVLSTRGDPVLERGWDGAFAFQQTDCGDLLAIDLRDPARAPVVTLSHDEDKILDEELGYDYQDFLVRWSALGCPPPEPWLLDRFMATAKGPLDPDGLNAQLWRKAIAFSDS